MYVYPMYTVLSIQVVGFVQKLSDLLEDYEIACEHEHSNCVLIAHKEGKVTICSHDLCVNVFFSLR